MMDMNEITYPGGDKDVYGHSLHGGIGEIVSDRIRNLSANFNNGKRINTIYQQLGYLVREGTPMQSIQLCRWLMAIWPLDLILKGIHGRLVVLRNGRYDNAPLDVVTSTNKIVDIKRYYNVERYRPHYKSFEFQPLFIMTGN